MSQETKDVTVAALLVVAALGAAIRELGEVPNAHLYAQVMSHLSLDVYNQCLSLLKRASLIREESNVLIWIGPPKE